MATVRMPSSLHAQMTRRAISPGLAIRIFLNMNSSFQLRRSFVEIRALRGWNSFPLEETAQTQKGAAQRASQELLASLFRPDGEQLLPVFNRLAVDRQFLHNLPGNIGLNLVEQLHSLDNPKHLTHFNRVPTFDQRTHPVQT